MISTPIRITALFLVLLLFTCLNGKAIKPSKTYNITPDSLGLNYSSIKVYVNDSVELNCWIYHPDSINDNHTVLILAYPDAGNMSNYIYHAAYLQRTGFTLISFDYRGFGQSSDFDINPNQLYYNEFCDDLIAVVNQATIQYPQSDIGIWALSMGTIVTTRSYNQIKNQIDFIIAESCITNTQKFVDRIRTIKAKEISLPPDDTDYNKLISSIETPLLVFAGSEDDFTTTMDAHSLKEQLSTNCKVIEYDGNHLGGFRAWPEKGIGVQYIQEITSFLEELE